MIIKDYLPDHNIIIGCIRDSQVHTGANAFQLMVSGLYDKLITLAEVKFMLACDLGAQWVQLSNTQPICGIDENGTPCFVKGGLAQPKAEVAPVAPIEGEVIPADATVQ